LELFYSVCVKGFMRIFPFLALSTQLFAVIAGFAQTPCKSTVVGDLRIEHFKSKMYGDSRTVRIWLPPGYADSANLNRKYPTLYLLDGQTAFDECTAFQGEHELQADETVTRLIAEHKIPPMIVVGIDSTEHRNYEYSPWKNPITDAKEPEPIGKQLPAFFGDELIPFVSTHYRVTDDAAHTGIGGTSLGAEAALYVALMRPDLFGLVLAESPSVLLGNGQLLRDTMMLARAPDRVAIGVGATELNFPKIEDYLAPFRLTEKDSEAAIVKMTEILASNLRAAYIKKPAVMLVVEPNANHSSAFWAGRLPEAVTFLYGEPATAH
jgi:predicted alpha/beta superfamily hydrolase